MKKLLSLIFLALFITGAFGQNSDQKWSSGLSGGKTVCVGDLGNGFSVWDPFYFHGAMQAGRYLNPFFDLALQVEHGAYGYYGVLLRQLRR